MVRRSSARSSVSQESVGGDRRVGADQALRRRLWCLGSRGLVPRARGLAVLERESYCLLEGRGRLNL